MESHPPALEKHTGWLPVKNAKWLYRPIEQAVAKIRELLDAIQAKKKDGLTGVVVVRDFVSHRIRPLKQRNNYGFEYLGNRVPARASSEDLPEEKMLELVRHLLKDAMPSACRVRPYCADRPPPAIRTLPLCNLP